MEEQHARLATKFAVSVLEGMETSESELPQIQAPGQDGGGGAPEARPVTVKAMAAPRQASPGPCPLITTVGAPCSPAGCSSARSGSSAGATGCYAGGSGNFPNVVTGNPANVVTGSPLLRARAPSYYPPLRAVSPAQVTYFPGLQPSMQPSSPEKEGRPSSQGPVARNIISHAVSWCPPRLPGQIGAPTAVVPTAAAAWASTPAAPYGCAPYVVLPAQYSAAMPSAMFRASSSSAERRKAEPRPREHRATATSVASTTPQRTAVAPGLSARATPGWSPTVAAAARPASPRQGVAGAGAFSGATVPAGRLEQHLAPDGTYVGPEDRYPNVEDLRLAVEEARRERLSWELQVALRREHLETARLQAEAHALDGVLEENTRQLADRLEVHRDDLLRVDSEGLGLVEGLHSGRVSRGQPPSTTGEVGRGRSSMASDTTLPPAGGTADSGLGGDPDGDAPALAPVPNAGDGRGSAWTREEEAARRFTPTAGVQPTAARQAVIPGRRVIMRTQGAVSAISGWPMPMQQGGLGVSVAPVQCFPPPAA